LKAAWLANQGTKGEPNYWLRENVLKPIWKELHAKETAEMSTAKRREFHYTPIEADWSLSILKSLINKYGKTRKQIAEEIEEFINYGSSPKFTLFTDNIERIITGSCDCNIQSKPEFYAYYADYDWVVFSWLIGRMIDLPKGFPMYCNDLKQELDMKLLNKTEWLDVTFKGNLDEKIAKIESLYKYPKQSNEHNALDDAKWNKELHEFIKTL